MNNEQFNVLRLSGQLATPKRLTDAEVTSLEKIAILRAQCGKYRAAIVTARKLLLQHEHSAAKPDYPIEALDVLSEALAPPSEKQETTE